MNFLKAVERASRLTAAYGRLDGRGRDTLYRLVERLAQTDRAFRTMAGSSRQGSLGSSPQRDQR